MTYYIVYNKLTKNTFGNLRAAIELSVLEDFTNQIELRIPKILLKNVI